MNRNRKMNRRIRRRSEFRHGANLISWRCCIEERIEAVARVAAAWLSKDSVWLRRAERAIPVRSSYSPAMVRACLLQTFSGYDVHSLRDWIRRDLPSKPIVPLARGAVLIVLPSTVLAPAWQAATAVWLAGGRVILAPSRREPMFARLLRESVVALAGKVLPVKPGGFPRKAQGRPLADPPACCGIIAYGNDQTLEHLQAPARAKIPLIGFGTRISLAYLGRPALKVRQLRALARAAAWDVALYDTQGCLSPQCFYVEEGGEVSPPRFAEALAGALRDLERVLPRRETRDDRWAGEAFWQKWFFRQSQGRAQFFGPRDCRVILEREARLEPAGLKRVVFVRPVKGIDGMLAHVAPWLGRISTIATAQAAGAARLERALGMKSGIRFCAVGAMHRPPAGWRNGGVNLLGTINQWLMAD